MRKFGIFDGDGTLFDTAFEVSRITAALAGQHGCPIPAEEVFSAEYAGHSMPHKFVELAKSRGHVFSDDTLAVLSRDHEARKGKMYEGDVVLIPGMAEALASLKGVKMSLGSANPSARSTFVATKTGIAHYFSGGIFGPDKTPTGRSKPHPDIFIAAMQAQGAKPEETFIVEDMNSGILAAARVAEVLGTKPLVVAYLDPRLGPDGSARVNAIRESFLRDGADIIIRRFDAGFAALVSGSGN